MCFFCWYLFSKSFGLPILIETWWLRLKPYRGSAVARRFLVKKLSLVYSRGSFKRRALIYLRALAVVQVVVQPPLTPIFIASEYLPVRLVPPLIAKATVLVSEIAQVVGPLHQVSRNGTSWVYVKVVCKDQIEISMSNSTEVLQVVGQRMSELEFTYSLDNIVHSYYM